MIVFNQRSAAELDIGPFPYLHTKIRGHAQAWWLRHYVASWKVMVQDSVR